MSFKINGKLENKVLLHLVPHGIDGEIFKPLSATDPKLIEFRKRVCQGKDINFIILYNSRNIQRKRTSNILLAYNQFCRSLPAGEGAKCLLVLHTEIALEAGTDLMAVKEAMCPDYNVLFSPGKISPDDLNLMYNVSDVTVCASSSEGFGLSTAESIFAGTPILATVTGGLVDQMGFVDEAGNPIEYTGDFGTNSGGKYKKHGRWVYPIYPATRMIQGSIPTPYIFDEIAKWEDFADGLMYWYLTPKSDRRKYGLEGREWALTTGGINAKNMAHQFMSGVDFVLKNWVKPKQFGLYSTQQHSGNTMPNKKYGFEIPAIDNLKIMDKIKSIKT